MAAGALSRPQVLAPPRCVLEEVPLLARALEFPPLPAQLLRSELPAPVVL
jgi:hypothetical protein